MDPTSRPSEKATSQKARSTTVLLDFDERAGAAIPIDEDRVDAPPDVVRRAPFADNPQVGARGQRTQQAILDAAILVFGEEGYDPSSIDSIAQRAGCSRASFYQYFSSKAEIFRHLSGQVARQLGASTEALEPLTADAAGWTALRAWVSRYSAIYARYQSVFHAFQAASESDETVATGSARWRLRTVAKIRARIVATRLPARELDPVIQLLLDCVSRTHDMARILRSDADGNRNYGRHYSGCYSEERVGDALADVLHRSLFGLQEKINVHPPQRRRPPIVPFDSAIARAFARDGTPPDLGAAGIRTREALLDAGRKVFVERGYHRTRVGDVTGAASMSRATFYRYFEDLDELARLLTTCAIRSVSAVLAEIPAPGEGEIVPARALRLWLHRYNVTQANEAAMIRVWVDASLQDPTLRASSAPALDWGRRRMSSFLAPRGFGDIDSEGLVMVALLSAFGARARSRVEVGAAARVIEQGLLGVASIRVSSR